MDQRADEDTSFRLLVAGVEILNIEEAAIPFQYRDIKIKISNLDL